MSKLLSPEEIATQAGGDALYGFSFTLFAGILVGTLSSITVASTVQELLGLSPQAYQKKEEELAEAA